MIGFLLSFPGCCLLTWGFFSWSNGVHAAAVSGYTQTAVSVQVESTAYSLVHGGAARPIQEVTGTSAMGIIIYPTAYWTETATPHSIIVGMDTPASVSMATPEDGEYALSFYDPYIYHYFPDDEQLRDINCMVWSGDAEMGDCVSLVHHGKDDYHKWIGKGAACSNQIPMDAVFEVIDPVELKGVWRCIDIGDLDKYVNGKWYHYIDFMLSYPDMVWTGLNLNDFPWSSPVHIRLLSEP